MSWDTTSDAELALYLASVDPDQARLDLISHASEWELRTLARWRP